MLTISTFGRRGPVGFAAALRQVDNTPNRDGGPHEPARPAPAPLPTPGGPREAGNPGVRESNYGRTPGGDAAAPAAPTATPAPTATAAGREAVPG